MKQFFVWLFLALSNIAFSQVTISGKLTNEAGNPISGASVTIGKTGTDNIIAYDISNDKGMYSISISATESEVDIRVRSIGFATVTKTIFLQTQTLNFTLKEKIVDLEEVIIKNSPIHRKGDTINYQVSSFAKEQDRSIADVLKRMPGIEVLSDGKILYQGKPINKYYIEGLDMLEGKYNIANENLPYKEVSKVQVLENHQPVKILDSLQFSDNAALNIKLKNSYAFTGQAEIGAGFSPMLWDANITPMLFSKKQQMLVSYQTNNVGKNVSAQIKTLTIEDLLEQFENNSEKQDWLRIMQLANPGFSKKRWLDNNVHMISGNYLYKLKKDYELHINTSYLNDYQQQNGFTNTLFFTPTDTISLFENKFNQLYYNSLETNITLQRNTNKNYLKNSLQFQGFWDAQKGNMQINNAPLLQDLSNRYFKLSNKLKTIFPIGKQLITLNSFIGLNQTPQTLRVNPGQFQKLLNNGNLYKEVFQKVKLQSFYTHNYIGFTKGWKKISFSPKVGFQFEKQNLKSQITTSESQNLSNEFKNDLDWTRSKLYVDLQTQYRNDKWRIDLTTPLNFHSYQIEDEPLDKRKSLERFTFEPVLSVIYDANALWKFNVSAGLSNQFGTINQLHYAYILQDYRDIQRINTPLPQIFNQTITGGISYRNPIKFLFWNMIYTYTKSDNNLLYKTQILENGATELQAMEQNNKRFSHNISTRVGKYYMKIKTNITLNANFGLQDLKQMLNNETTNIKNQNWGIGGKIETEITDWYNIEYQTNWLFSKNKIQKQSNKTITRQSHLLNFNFYSKKNQYITLRTEYIKNNLFSENTENLFTDILYRYTWKKKNTDVELQWNNIFNTENYRTIEVDAFSYVETNFKLRPRQLLLKIRFSL